MDEKPCLSMPTGQTVCSVQGNRALVLNSGNTEQALALPVCYAKFPFKDAPYYLAIATYFTLKGDSAKARSGGSSW